MFKLARLTSLVLGGSLLLTPLAGGQTPHPGGAQPTPLPPTTVEGARSGTGFGTAGSEFLPRGDGRGTIDWSSDAITSDSTPVGSYNQPAWTTQRPFTSVRAYVLPEGQWQVEQWYRPRWKKDGTREDRVLEEIAIGLPHRLQLDLYWRWNIKQDEDQHYNANHEGVQLELRWALANWGEIPLNPTLYGEWIQRSNKDDEPDKYELKALLADSFLNDRIFWAANFILEQEVGGEKETELGFSQAFSTTIIERKLMAGVEMWYRQANVHGSRADWERQLLVGPTLQWRPTNRTFLDVAPLIGCTKDAPKVELFIVFGFQFGQRAGPSYLRPASRAE